MARFSDEERGRVDGVSFLYIAGGIPTMIVFFVVLFFFARTCNLPA